MKEGWGMCHKGGEDTEERKTVSDWHTLLLWR